MTVFHIGAGAGAGSRVLEVTFLALHKPTLLFLTFSWPILLFLAQRSTLVLFDLMRRLLFNFCDFILM